ncbi:MAG TPA: STN domain-containing protein, partial [Puia sp.]
MKLTSFLLLVVLMQVSARSYEQTVSLNQKNADLGSVFKKITKQTGYTFLYNDRVLARARKVDIDVHDMRLEDALAICFMGQPLEYSILNKTVVIRARVERVTGDVDTPPLV